jgi:hypothetical protein
MSVVWMPELHITFQELFAIYMACGQTGDVGSMQ